MKVSDDKYVLAIREGPWSCSAGKAIKHLGKDVNGKSIVQYFHHLILPPKEGFEVDHRDNDGLNNQDDNLRYLEHWQNIHNREKQKNNTSGFIGVRWSDSANGWQSSIQVKGKRVHFGTFKTAEEAALAREAFVKSNLPGIAKLNFP